MQGEAKMTDKRTVLWGIGVLAMVGAVSLNITPKESLGCGGTEFASGSGECPVAEFHMTMDSEDWDPIARKMCFRSLKSEDGCTVYRYGLVPVTEDAPEEGEPTTEYVNITYGTGCKASKVEGALVETVNDEVVVMTLSGTAMHAPIPLVETAEPLGAGSCASNKYQAGEFELFVSPLEG